MRKIKALSFLLLTLALSLSSCKKDKITNNMVAEKTERNEPLEKPRADRNDYSGLRIIKNTNTLEFSSIDYYESFVSGADVSDKVYYLMNYLDKIEFRSLKTLEKNIEEEDDFLEAILDENFIVKIGKWYIKLNLEEERVFACSEENIDAYNLVLREDSGNSEVYEFTFDDEVLVLLKDEANLKSKGWFRGCKERKARSRSTQTLVHNIYNFNGVSMDAELASSYKRRGIYFTLISVGAVSSTDINLGSRVTMWFYLSNCSYKVRCRNEVLNYTYPTRYPTSLTMLNRGYTMKGRFRWYLGTKQLKYYDYRIRMRIDHTYYATPPNSFTDIYSQWTHISDY